MKHVVLVSDSWILFLVQQIAVYSMYVAVMAFFARVSDPAVGGTYMTLLNTLSNLGGNWPSTLALWMVDSLTYKQCSAPGLQNNACITTKEVEVICWDQAILRQCRWLFSSSGMWCCLVRLVLPDVWKVYSAFITGLSLSIFVPLGPGDEQRHYTSSKCQELLAQLHSVMSKKTWCIFSESLWFRTSLGWLQTAC